MRVLIVDDHDLFRTGLRTLLENEGFEVADASSAMAAVATGRAFEPDVVVMDVHMPEVSGVDATRLVLRDRPGTPVLMLTVIADDADVLAAVRAGASGYLLKDARLSDIVAGIHGAAAGHSTFAPPVAGALLESVRSVAAARRRQPTLAEREQQVLSLLALGRDNGEIGQHLGISPSTVKQHVSRLLQKLSAANRVQAAVAAIRLGLVENRGETEPSRA